MNLSKDQLHTLRHMLGINDPSKRTPTPYRNYAAVNPGDPEFLELERIWAVEKCASPAWSDYTYYRVTPAGKDLAIKSHRHIRYSRSKRKYIKFLEIRDCSNDLSFHQFLTMPEFRETRRNA